MGRSLKFIIACVAGGVLVLIVLLLFSINSIVKSGIEDIGSEITGTKVTVDRVMISPFSGKGRIFGFRISNPEDFSDEYAFEVDEISIELSVLSLFTNEILVNQLIVTAPAIFVEQKLTGNNINTILRNIRNMEPGEVSDSEMVIEHFLLTSGSAELYTEVGGERSARAEIAEVELNDLGRGGGRQALEDVIQEIAERVAEEAIKGAAQSGREQLEDTIRNLFE